MRVTQRYEIVSPWSIVDRKVFWVGGSTENHALVLMHEVADIQDTQDGVMYSRGVHKVYATHLLSQKSAKKVKTFYGESSWSDATRLYDDIYFAYQREGSTW